MYAKTETYLDRRDLLTSMVWQT